MTLGTMTPLRRLCIERGITRAQLADKADISLRQIYNIDSKVSRPTEATLFALAQVLKVEPIELAEALGLVDNTKAAA